MLKLSDTYRVQAETTRERIMAAARELWLLNGTRGTTTRDIAEKAGVNEATVFRHFGTKQALLDQMREHYCGAAYSEQILGANSGDIAADLRAIAAGIMTVLAANREMICIGMAEEARDPEGVEVTWRGPVMLKERVVDRFRQFVAAGVVRGEPEVLTKVFLGMLFGIVVPKKLITTDRPVEAVAALCVDIFLNGARDNRGSA